MRAKQKAKDRHDKEATEKSFFIADKVLVFSPVVTGKLTAKLQDRWQGPYEIIGKVSPVTYLVEMPDRHKRRRSVHVEALLAWIPPVMALYSSEEENVLKHSDPPDYRPSAKTDEISTDPELSENKKQELEDLVRKLQSDAGRQIGRTYEASHRIITNIN